MSETTNSRPAKTKVGPQGQILFDLDRYDTKALADVQVGDWIIDDIVRKTEAKVETKEVLQDKGYVLFNGRIRREFGYKQPVAKR